MRLHRLSTLAAATLMTPALVVLPAPAQGEPAQKPVGTTQEKAALVDPARPEVGDGDRATLQDRERAESATPEVGDGSDLVVLGATGRQELPEDLAVIGVTWEGEKPLAVQYRTEGPEGWGAWQSVDTETESEGEQTATARAGSDPVVVTGAVAVQARILGKKGDAPRNPVLSVIDPGRGEGDANTGAQPGAAQAAAARPTIRSRAQWGADESIRGGEPSYGVVRGAIVHHTAGSNNYTPDQVPAVLRGIYEFHVKDRGWSDIGYNFLVDKWGRVWEGRYGGTSRAVVGAQASGFNQVTMGISLMGDYYNVDPSPAAIDAITRTIAWKASIHGFDPRGTFSWKGGVYRNISGHKDVGNTDCPGRVYNFIPGMIVRAAALKGSVGGTAPSPQTPGTSRPPAATPGAVGRVGLSDALMASATGRLLAVAPSGSRSAKAVRTVDGRTNWPEFSHVSVSPDMNGDGTPDVLVVGKWTGQLYFFPGESGGLGEPETIGRGWGAFSKVLAPGDFSGDGKADVLATDPRNGRLYLYTGRGNGRVNGGKVLGTGWTGMKHLVAVGDMSGDRKPDLLGVTRDNRAWLYRGNGRGGWAGSRIPLGSVAEFSSIAPMKGAARVLGVRPDGSAAILTKAGNSLRRTPVSSDFQGVRVFGG